MTKRIVMFSGGIGSWACADRVIEQHGRDGVVLLFADVKGNDDIEHVGEDPDCYRFIDDASKQLDVPLVTLREGRNIWQVFHDNRFLGNSRLANCSKFLKQYPARDWLKEHCDPDQTTVYVGIGWDEVERMDKIGPAYVPFPVEAPMCDAPFLDREQMLQRARSRGLTPPLMYEQGFAHANCQGACVRAGQAQWRLLLDKSPQTYAYHEAEEQKLRDHLQADVAILRDRGGYTSTPLTLRTFRERIQVQPSMFDDLDYGGCGCFVDDGPDLPADTPLLTGRWWET